MTKDIENFFEIEKKDISECGILHWSNYKEKLTPINRPDIQDTLNIFFFFIIYLQISKILIVI